MIKVNVDLRRCDATGTCAALMPDVLQDENGALFLFRKGDLVTEVLTFERHQEFVQLPAKLRQPLAWEVALGIPSGFEHAAVAVPVP